MDIPQGQELDRSLQVSGFDRQEIETRANLADSTPPPPPQIEGINREALAAIGRIVEQNEKEDNVPLDVRDVASQLSNSGFDTSKPLIDVLV